MTYLFTSPCGSEDIAVTISLPEAAALDTYAERSARVRDALEQKLGAIKGRKIFYMWTLTEVF